MWLLIAFIVVPLIEIGLFIQVGGTIGLWPTLLIVLITAVLGTYLVRTQGTLALNQLRNSFTDARDPTEPFVHGAMILFAGALLLTPGFFTDAVGFALLIPAVRSTAYQNIRSRMNVQSFATHGGQPNQGEPARGATRSDVIDGDYHEISDTPDDKDPSGWTKH